MAKVATEAIPETQAISVIVPTYRRVESLTHCLDALESQTCRPGEIVVTVREGDAETISWLAQRAASSERIKMVTVSQAGVVAAMNAGLAAARGNIISLTDDDAAPWPDWLARIKAHFAADPALGGIGGRDWVYKKGVLDEGQSTSAGKLAWFGRVGSGHHHAVGSPRTVCVLKGVNCAYRAEALKPIGFDTRMAGAGAQVHWELALGLAMQRAGWKLVLDPAVGVDHFPASRFDEDQRNSFSALAQQKAVANETLVLLEHLRGPRRAAFVVWCVSIGTRSAPGLLQLPRLIMMRKAHPISLWWATMRGRIAGMRMARNSAKLEPHRADLTRANCSGADL